MYIPYYHVFIDATAPENPDGSVVIKNIAPLSWSGRFFDCHIYKDNHSFVTQPDVHSGDRATIEIKPILYFSVAKNIKIGQSFESYETSEPFEFNLAKYPSGMEVTLYQQPGGGRYYFTAKRL